MSSIHLLFSNLSSQCTNVRTGNVINKSLFDYMYSFSPYYLVLFLCSSLFLFLFFFGVGGRKREGRGGGCWAFGQGETCGVGLEILW